MIGHARSCPLGCQAYRDVADLGLVTKGHILYKATSAAPAFDSAISSSFSFTQGVENRLDAN